MSLIKYNKKRDFKQTAEPAGKTVATKGALKFVVQRHAATRLHFDFRLEMEGVLKSWAVPKGPSLNPVDKRLAMMVEDHPYSYRTFEGEIPEGNYGAGFVEVWDEGTYEHITDNNKKTGEKKLLHDLHAGSLKFILHGKKLKGEFALVHLKNGRDENAWLLIKHKDEYAVSKAYDANEFVLKTSRVTKAVNEKLKVKDVKKKAVIKDNLTEKSEPSKAKKSSVKKKLQPETKSPINKFAAKLGLSSEKKINDFVEPMFATAGDNKPFDGENWLFEIKWDGYRAVTQTGTKTPLLYSRKGLSFANKYDVIYDALKKIKQKLILDGEIVVFDEDGKPDFQSLQHYDDNRHLPIVYYVFDVIEHNGKRLTDKPLSERKALLKKLLPENELIKYCDHIEDNGIAFFNEAIAANLEGIIAKRKESLYQIGRRSPDWLKIKNQNTEEVVIAGYTEPRASRKFFGALILGRYENNELVYAGHTGTGFDDASLKELHKKLQPLIVKTSPFKIKPKTNMPATWVKPALVCNIKFTELTTEKIFRHPVFMGIRDDKAAKEVIVDPDKISDMKTQVNSKKSKAKSVKQATKKVATTAKSVAKKASPKSSSKKIKATVTINKEDNDKVVTINKHELKLTNQNKIYWPNEGYTKGDMIAYYNHMHKYILPYLKNRPESLNRFPHGITGESFYQKDAGGQAPEWVESVDVFSESNNKNIDYILCNDLATLTYLNNLGCIELNPWNSTTKALDHPDYMVIDLDPSDNNTFEHVIDTALATKEVLDRIGAVGYCKTSGSTGLHIYVPMGAKYTYDEVKNFANIIVMQVNEMLPNITTLERNLKKRGNNKLYLDYLQNRTGQTLASAYSLRPKPGATASAPLEWKEVKHGLHPTQFDIITLPKRVAKIGDIFKPVLGKGIDMLKCIKKLDI